MGVDNRHAAHWTQVKAMAIAAVCKKCYSLYPGQTWKNVLSIGDSIFEQRGTRDATQHWQSENMRIAYQPPRTKTVKMQEEPTADQIADQLKVLCSWLPALVKQDQGFNVALERLDSGTMELDALLVPTLPKGDGIEI